MTVNAAMAEYWNEAMGPVWVELQVQLDRQTQPLGAPAIDALALQPGQRVLDIGCGCGQSTWEMAERVTPGGMAMGVDISAPMLDVARHRPHAAGVRAEFRQVDVQAGDLGPGGYDAAFSRFGVMFFDDPTAAFANIRQSLKPSGRVTFVCWRTYDDNPIMRAPAEAAAPFLPLAEPADPTAPGPFAFADPDRVRGILRSAGLTDIAIEPFDTRVGGADLDEALALALRIGPLPRALSQLPTLGPGWSRPCVRRWPPMSPPRAW